jgi:hypothetical protein
LDLTIVEAVSRHHRADLALPDELSTAKIVFDANQQVCAGGTAPGKQK